PCPPQLHPPSLHDALPICIGSDRRDESIPLAGQRLDELWMVGGITQRVAQVIHRLVETAIEVDERIGGPQPPRQFFTRDKSMNQDRKSTRLNSSQQIISYA